MKTTKFLSLAVLAIAVAVTGCTQDDKKPTGGGSSGTPKKEGDHPHGKGPNGGVVFDLGKYHAEFTVDHNKKECTVLVIDGEDENAKPLPVAAKEFTVSIKETRTKKEGKVVPPMTIKMLPRDESGGKASKFVGTDPGLGNVADFEGTVTGVIDDKPSKGIFKEEDEAPAKK